jgi:Glycosyl transferase family 2
MFKDGVIVIPTRNRADLAMNAIRSVLQQPGCKVQVIVSDNSTSAEEIAKLSDFCRQADDARLRYVKPEQPLPISEHWEWALGQALSEESDHFSFLTDRMVFRPQSLSEIFHIVKRFPDKIVCYMHDKVFDFAQPVTIYQNEWSGKLYEVASRRLLELSAQSVMYDAGMPRMLNCFVPRSLLEAIRQRFGSVFSSIAPDWVFGYRALELVDSILFFHKAALVHYAQSVSNGESAHRGIMNETYSTFVKEMPKPRNSDAPFPEIITVWNAIISEYCWVKKETRSAKFPELDMEKYMQALSEGIQSIEDPSVKGEMTAKLAARGWHPDGQPQRTGPSLARKLISPRRIITKAKLMVSPLKFETSEAAVGYALQHSGPKSRSQPWDKDLHQGVEIAL